MFIQISLQLRRYGTNTKQSQVVGAEENVASSDTGDSKQGRNITSLVKGLKKNFPCQYSSLEKGTQLDQEARTWAFVKFFLPLILPFSIM